MNQPLRSSYCGTWYPQDSSELHQLLDRLFAQSQKRTGSWLIPSARGFVVPHAGLIYSGTVAASAYRHIRQQQPRRIVALAFSHQRHFSGLWMPDAEAYWTPVGITEVDLEAVEALTSARPFHLMPEAVMCDHSLEIQLPLLSYAAPGARIVPVFVGRLTQEERSQAAFSLASLADSRTVFVASSDFTHYGRDFCYQPFPTGPRISDQLHDLDSGVMESAGSLEPEVFFSELEKTGSTVCGRQPISLLLETMRILPGEELYQTLLDYQTSSEITGDWEHSVSYAALGYFPAPAFYLSDWDQQLLLESARRTLSHFQQTGERRLAPPPEESPALDRTCGVFVSLHRQGRLRGCVGCVSGYRPLREAVPELTLAAACEDTRFPVVGQDETDIDIEISVLTPLKRVSSPERILTGAHGVHASLRGHSGVLLPQVATEWHLDRDQFLRALAAKAHVTEERLSDPEMKLFAFRAQVFGETHAPAVAA